MQYFQNSTDLQELHLFSKFMTQSLQEHLEQLLKVDRNVNQHRQIAINWFNKIQIKESDPQILSQTLKFIPTKIEKLFINTMKDIYKNNKKIIENLLSIQKKLELKFRALGNLQLEYKRYLSLKEQISQILQNYQQVDKKLQDLNIIMSKKSEELLTKKNLNKEPIVDLLQASIPILKEFIKDIQKESTQVKILQVKMQTCLSLLKAKI